MVYTGGFFEGVDFVTAFANCSASMGLVLGSAIALMFTFVFYRVRGVMTFQDFAACIPEGFKAMVSPMLILTLAWTLSGMTGLLGAKYYVASLLSGSAAALQYLLPIIIFLVAVFLAFATGTSWGTFSILVPIVCHAFPEGEMLVVSIAACLSGAVCGDHCSPISDTTIMASAGAHCFHRDRCKFTDAHAGAADDLDDHGKAEVIILFCGRDEFFVFGARHLFFLRIDVVWLGLEDRDAAVVPACVSEEAV